MCVCVCVGAGWGQRSAVPPVQELLPVSCCGFARPDTTSGREAPPTPKELTQKPRTPAQGQGSRIDLVQRAEAKPINPRAGAATVAVTTENFHH